MTVSGGAGPNNSSETAGARWVNGSMKEPRFRNLVANVQGKRGSELEEWAEAVAFAYSKSGSLEVTAVVWALLDEIDRLRVAS